MLFELVSGVEVLTEVPVLPKDDFEYIFEWSDLLNQKDWRFILFKYNQFFRDYLGKFIFFILCFSDKRKDLANFQLRP